MNKPKKLKPGDKVAIVSLSSGILGEAFVSHQLELGEARMRDLGLIVRYMPNSLRGLDYLANNPQAKAEDLKQAFLDPSISAVICAIGGFDTYRTLPYLLDDPGFIEAVKNNPKIFMGFSDTTTNHFMFYKLGLQTYYGPSYLTDFGELGCSILPYAKTWIDRLFESESSIEIESSPVWYEERTSFGVDQLNTERVSHPELHGHEVLQGNGVVRGRLLGGCLESIYYMMEGSRFEDQVDICDKYNILPSKEEWKGKVLFLETSEERPSPDVIRKMLNKFRDKGIFEAVSGVLVGKPQNEQYYEEYKQIWREIGRLYDLPIIYNLNFGHGDPRCILPYWAEVRLDLDAGRVFIEEPLVA